MYVIKFIREYHLLGIAYILSLLLFSFGSFFLLFRTFNYIVRKKLKVQYKQFTPSRLKSHKKPAFSEMYFHIPFSIYGRFEILLLVSGHGSFSIIKKQLCIGRSYYPLFRDIDHQASAKKTSWQTDHEPSCSWQTTKSSCLLQTTPVLDRSPAILFPERQPDILFLTNHQPFWP